MGFPASHCYSVRFWGVLILKAPFSCLLSFKIRWNPDCVSNGIGNREPEREKLGAVGSAVSCSALCSAPLMHQKASCQLMQPIQPLYLKHWQGYCPPPKSRKGSDLRVT